MMMTKEDKEQWEKLYKIGVQLKDIAPWEKFWDMDIFAVTYEGEETAYFSVLGRGGYEKGICMYLGINGFNDLMGIINSERLNLPGDYVMLNQNNFSMFIGNRDEVPPEQYQVIKELGLKFRGNGNWMYFEVFEKGYWPFIPNGEEVMRGIHYMEKLIDAFLYYQNSSFNVKFENGEMFEYYEKNGVWEGKASALPLYKYEYPVVFLSDKLLKKKLQEKMKEKRTGMIIEANIFHMKASVEKGYKKPMLPRCAVLADHKRGLFLNQRLVGPDEGDEALTQLLAEWILDYGLPQKVIVANPVILGLVNDLCSYCKIEVCCDELKMPDVLKEEVNKDTMPNLDEMKQLLKHINEAGFDNLKEMNEDMTQDMTEEELRDYILSIMPQVTEMLNERLTMIDSYDNWMEPVYYQHDLKNRKQKTNAVKEYYGMGEMPEEIYEGYEKEIMLDYGSDTWKERLLEGKKGELLAIAKELDLKVDQSFSKEMLVSLILSSAVLEPDSIKKLLGKEELKLFRFLKKKVKQFGNDLRKEDFPFSMEVVLRLLTLGFIDIGYGNDEYSLTLEIYVTKEVFDLI